MTGRDLVKRAFRREECERVPWVPFCGVHSASLIGKTAQEILQSADLLCAAQEKAIERYQPDGIPVIFDLQVEAEILGCSLVWSEDNPPAVTSHPLNEGVGLGDLSLPKGEDGRIPLIMEATERLRANHPEIALYGLITGPFTLGMHLLGPAMFMEMFDNPAAVNNILSFCSEAAQRMVDFYHRGGCDIVAVVDPMTSQIGPEQFREYCTQPSIRVFDHIRGLGLGGAFFVCGHAMQNLEAMSETGCDCISVDENIPLEHVGDLCRNRDKAFGGNLQLTVTMLNGTPDDNRRNAVECLEIGGCKGYILSPGCDIPFATPPENIEAIAEVAHNEYAREAARAMAIEKSDPLNLADMSEYGQGATVVVDIITLDSEACTPCQYMVEAIKQVVPHFEGIVEWREHKIKYRESIAFMSALMVRNIPTICIDGKITFVSQIPPRDKLIEAIQKRINEKTRLRIESQSKVIRVFGPPDDDCLVVRERVKEALSELGAEVRYEEIEDVDECRERFGVFSFPSVATAKQRIKSVGRVPEKIAVKEWIKQLDE